MSLLTTAAGAPQTFWLLLALVCLIIVGFSIYYLLRNHRFRLLFMQTVSQITEVIAALDRCHIENLEPTRDALQSEKFTLLKIFGDKLLLDSDRLYQGKWIPDPTPLLTPDRVLTRSDYRSSSIEIPIQILSISVLATSIFLLVGLSGGTDNNTILRLGFLPAILGAVFALLLFFQSYRSRQSMKRGLTHLGETITEKVPVFRELAGTAALIESFFRYDRQMSDSISVLARTVDQLTHNTLAEQLAENVRLVMEREVAPPLVTAADTLSALAEELTSRQEEGMKDLAENFAASLATSLDEQLRPFYQEISNLTQDLYEANKQTEISLQTMEAYKQQSLDIQQGLIHTMSELNQSRTAWEADLKSSSESLQNLALTSEKLATLQAGSEENLAAEISLLRQRTTELQDSLYRVTQGLHLENQQGSETVRQLTESSQKTLGDMRQLTMLLVDQTDRIAEQNDILHRALGGLETGLNESVKNFSNQLLAGVDETLDSFDEGLAEVTSRLSNTTAEINDTVGTWVSDVRWSEEYRYRSRLEKEEDRSGKKQALLDILSGETPEAEDEEERKDGDTLE